MIKRTMIATGVALAITTTLTANIALAEEESSFMDELEISGELKNESAIFTNGGQTIGQATSMTDTTTKHDSGDLYKSESSAKIFINGDVGEDGSSFHAELNLRYDTEAVDGYKGAKSYSQHDLLRELYVDTEVGDEDSPVSLRIGKQQVVWGTADGIKLLDIINPTDWREFAQNTMDESRIPVWMLNGETDLDSGGNVQFILSQAEENKIPGLGIASESAVVHSSADQGQPFVMKGVDSITGRINGFLNAAPDIGGTAAVFNGGFGDLSGFNKATVGEFFNNEVPGFVAGACGGGACSATVMSGFTAQAHSNAGTTTNVLNNTVIDTTKTDYSTSGLNSNEGGTNPGSVFAYMTDATFATFNSFSGATSEYRVVHPSDSTLNTGLRYKGSTNSGMNYSVNYMNHYDSNPYIDMHWEDSAGNKLTQTVTSLTGDGNNINGNGDQTGRVYKTISLGAGIGFVSGVGDTLVTNSPVLVFEEKLNKINSYGASLDTAVDTESLGAVVLRGEFLYNQDEMAPVVDRNKLAYGDLPGGLTMTKSDMFKYVLGADVTVATNLMLSGQFIQFRNLDYVDNATDSDGNACGQKVNCGVYTADMAAMHMSNGLQKAEENKEFYSFFMSKPFGAEQQHRWNNIFMFEENGGKWNRFDVEYSFNDELIGMAEMNKYWGDTNTQFGQMENSSNLQLGLKYIF